MAFLELRPFLNYMVCTCICIDFGVFIFKT